MGSWVDMTTYLKVNSKGMGKKGARPWFIFFRIKINRVEGRGA